jgi:hypothetical protein
MSFNGVLTVMGGGFLVGLPLSLLFRRLRRAVGEQH